MSRQLRKRKEVPTAHIPTILDEIAVCWLVNGSKLCWQATVIELYEYENVQEGKHGKGKYFIRK